MILDRYMNYYDKYLKYKNKYISLQNQKRQVWLYTRLASIECHRTVQFICFSIRNYTKVYKIIQYKRRVTHHQTWQLALINSSWQQKQQKNVQLSIILINLMQLLQKRAIGKYGYVTQIYPYELNEINIELIKIIADKSTIKEEKSEVEKLVKRIADKRKK